MVGRAGAVPLTFTYPQWVGWGAFTWPSGPLAHGLVRRLALECERLAARHGGLAVIAHSFGCALIARALVEAPRVKLSGLILFGSILPERFAWEAVVRRGQVPLGQIRNELGLHAPPVRWAGHLQYLGLPYGASGVRGFRATPVDYLYKRRDATIRSLVRHCRAVWLPFLGLDASRRAAQAARRPRC